MGEVEVVEVVIVVGIRVSVATAIVVGLSKAEMKILHACVRPSFQCEQNSMLQVSLRKCVRVPS